LNDDNEVNNCKTFLEDRIFLYNDDDDDDDGPVKNQSQQKKQQQHFNQT